MNLIKLYIYLAILFLSVNISIAIPAGMDDKLKKSIVEVYARDSRSQGNETIHNFKDIYLVKGTGFCVDVTLGLFVTNKHVASILNYGQPTIMNFSGRQIDAKVIYTDPLYDLSVIQVQGSPLNPVEFEALDLAGLNALDFDSPDGAKSTQYWVCSTRMQSQASLDNPNAVADKLYEAGFRQNHFIYVRSIGTPLRCEFQKRWEVRFHNGKTIPGDSGSPVINDAGQVVALAWGGGNSESVAAPGDYVKQVVESLRAGTLPTRTFYKASGQISNANAATPHLFLSDPGKLAHFTSLPAKTKVLKDSSMWTQKVCAWKQLSDHEWGFLFKARPVTDLEAIQFDLTEGEILVQLKSCNMRQIIAQHGDRFSKPIDAQSNAVSSTLGNYARLKKIGTTDIRGLSADTALQAVHQALWNTTPSPTDPQVPINIPLELEAFDGSGACIVYTYSMDPIVPSTKPGACHDDLIFHFSSHTGVPSFVLEPGHLPVERRNLIRHAAPSSYRSLIHFDIPDQQTPSVGESSGSGGSTRTVIVRRVLVPGRTRYKTQKPEALSSAKAIVSDVALQKEMKAVHWAQAKAKTAKEKKNAKTCALQLSRAQSVIKKAQAELRSPKKALSASTRQALQIRIRNLLQLEKACTQQKSLASCVRKHLLWLRKL